MNKITAENTVYLFVFYIKYSGFEGLELYMNE